MVDRQTDTQVNRHTDGQSVNRHTEYYQTARQADISTEVNRLLEKDKDDR